MNKKFICINKNNARLLVCLAIIFIMGNVFSLRLLADGKHDLIDSTKQNSDTNKIIKIIYPPLTEREGLGLNIPIPPTDHPRLFLNKKDILFLKEKINSPLLKECWERILTASKTSTDGVLKRNGEKSNLDLNIRNAIEAKALLFVLNNNQELGKEAVDAVLNFYATLHIDMAKADVCRDIGRAIVTGAIVYDWCYPIISAAEKQTLIGRMETLATKLEVEWPKLVQGSVVGHGVEAQLSRDMLSCGIATYNEKPQIYNLVAGRIIAEFAPARKFFYPAAYHHQGSAYGPYRFNWDMNATFIFDKMGYPNIFGTDQAKVPYFFLYARRGDGQLLRNGDDFNELFTPFGQFWTVGGNTNALAGSYFKDPILINESIKEGTWGKGADYLFDFLFFDPIILSKINKTTLPLTSYFKEPLGAMIARTGWEDGIKSPSVVAEMKVGVYDFVNHQHLDAGSFQVYYKGPLTVQSGIYQGKTGAYGSDHFKNYSQRSVAHNTMLIYDPNEQFIWNNKAVINDGGQRFPNKMIEPKTLKELLQNDYKVGDVIAHQFGPDTIKPEYSYLKGELAPAYSNKVKSFERSFVFLNFNDASVPAALIVFDNVSTSNKDFKKYWLLHSVEEPKIDGNTTTIIRSELGYDGKMINTTLLPSQEDLMINKIGGSGNEYNVFGKNFPQSLNNPAISSADSAVWRIEVSPKSAAVNNLFLNVMTVMHNKENPSKSFMPEKIETDNLVGTKISDRIVLFSKNNNAISGQIKLKITGDKDYKVLITDVENGIWTINAVDNKSVGTAINSDTHVLYFTIKSGDYVISKK